MEKFCYQCDRFRRINSFPSMMHNNTCNASKTTGKRLLCEEEKCCREWSVCASLSENSDKNLPKILKTEQLGFEDFSSAMSSDDVMRVYSERINQLEQRIHAMKVERKAIQASSCKLKKEIQEQINGEMSLLRKRELQLYRQVDALYNHQSSLLQEHLSKLHSVLGSYRTTLVSLSHQKDSDSVKNDLANTSSYEEVMSCFPKQKLQFVVDDINLESLIQSYGRVEVSGGQTGIFLLPDEEEYEDENHLFLSKPLLKEQASEKNIQSCKIHNNSQDSNMKPCIISPHPTEKFTPQTLLKCALNAQLALNKDIANPLKIHLEGSPCSTESFEVIMPDYIDDANNKKIKESELYCNCEHPADMDIESLSGLSCTSSHATEKAINVSEWLRKNEALTCSYPDGISHSIPPVKVLCKADKKCSSYAACVCRVNCLVMHLKEQLERLRLSDNNMFSKRHLNHTINQVIQNETHRKESNDSASSCSASPGVEKMDVQMHSSSTWDIENWLRPKEVVKAIPAETEGWLSTSSVMEDQPDATGLVKRLFASFFEKENIEQWLCESRGRCKSQC